MSRFSNRSRLSYVLLTPVFLWAMPASAQVPLPQSPREKAWNVLRTGLKESQSSRRAAAVRVLGLVRDDPQARELAEGALKDEKPDVRVAAAYALGAMGAKASILKLQQALADKEISVVLAAGQALITLGDNSGYEVYYEILTGERKPKMSGLKNEKMFADPGKLTEFGFEQALGFVPFASIGFETAKELAKMTKADVGPVRAAAAKVLTDDPDAASGEALAKAALSDKHWVVRVAALDAIARRGGSSLLNKIVPAMSDDKDAVRYTAAAAVLHLSAPARR